MTRRHRLLILASAGGAIGSTCWLPLGLAPLIFVGAALAQRALREATTPREALTVGLAFGAARYLVAAHFLLWLLRYSPLAIVFYLLAVAYILPFAALESWGAWQLERWSGVPRGAWLAVLYSLLEYVRTLGDLSFPADLLAHAFGTAPVFLAWTAVTGPFAVSLLVFLVGWGVEAAMLPGRPPRRRAALLAIALGAWLLPPATGLLLDRRDAGTSSIRVGIVQPSLTVEDKLDPARREANWKLLADLTRRAAQGADLVLWPETARPGHLLWPEGKPLADPPMETLAREIGTPILYGCEIARHRGRRVTALYNGAVLVDPARGTVDWYGKIHLLPFAEGVPFARLLGWDPSRRDHSRGGYLTLLGNFSPGPRRTVFRVGPARIGVLICYEGFYPALARGFRREGANTLAVLTNDAWWGRSLFAPWHARMAAARAREEDVPVLRAANSGVSSIAGPDGRQVARTGLFERTVLHGRVPVGGEPTFYSRHGDRLVGLLLLAVALGLAAPFFRRRS